jgi:uncharacterized protein with HEPN domain
MDRDPASILDIVLACRRSRRFVAGRTRADLDRDELLLYAVLHAIALIGEAASRLSATFRTRNRIIHGYDTVRIDIIWDIATSKVELLLQQLAPLVAPGSGTPPGDPQGNPANPTPPSPPGPDGP